MGKAVLVATSLEVPWMGGRPRTTLTFSDGSEMVWSPLAGEPPTDAITIDEAARLHVERMASLSLAANAPFRLAYDDGHALDALPYMLGPRPRYVPYHDAPSLGTPVPIDPERAKAMRGAWRDTPAHAPTSTITGPDYTPPEVAARREPAPVRVVCDSGWED